MAVRTTSAAVQGVLRLGSQGGDYDDANNPSLTPYIDSATVIVDRVATCAIARSKTLTTAEKELIERWLAAHLYMMSDQQYASKNTAGAGGGFRAQGGRNLDGSTYGQTAKTLDYSGCLEAIDKRKTAGIAWLGRAPSAQTDYVDRD